MQTVSEINLPSSARPTKGSIIYWHGKCFSFESIHFFFVTFPSVCSCSLALLLCSGTSLPHIHTFPTIAQELLTSRTDQPLFRKRFLMLDTSKHSQHVSTILREYISPLTASQLYLPPCLLDIRYIKYISVKLLRCEFSFSH